MTTASTQPWIIELARAIGRRDKCVETSIDDLSHEGRKAVRQACESLGIDEMPRNLFYDYKLQCWID